MPVRAQAESLKCLVSVQQIGLVQAHAHGYRVAGTAERSFLKGVFCVLQSAGLVLVHAHSRLVAETPGTKEGGPHSLLTADQLSDQHMKPAVPLWHFYLDR